MYGLFYSLHISNDVVGSAQIEPRPFLQSFWPYSRIDASPLRTWISKRTEQIRKRQGT